MTVTIPVGSQSRHPHFTHDSPLPFSLQAHCDPPPRLCTLVCAGLLPDCPPDPSTPRSVDPSVWTWPAQSLCWPQSAEGNVATSGYTEECVPFSSRPLGTVFLGYTHVGGKWCLHEDIHCQRRRLEGTRMPVSRGLLSALRGESLCGHSVGRCDEDGCSPHAELKGHSGPWDVESQRDGVWRTEAALPRKDAHGLHRGGAPGRRGTEPGTLFTLCLITV